MNLLYCHGFMNNINPTVILLCPSRMLNFFSSKGCVILERNINNLLRIENEAKQIIHAMDNTDSGYIMTCNTATYSISNTLKKLWIQSYLH